MFLQVHMASGARKSSAGRVEFIESRLVKVMRAVAVFDQNGCVVAGTEITLRSPIRGVTDGGGRLYAIGEPQDVVTNSV